MDLDGYYINLDRSPERRSMMEQQLHDFGLAGLISRFVAIDGHQQGPFSYHLDNAVHACRKSHEKTLALSKPSSATLIFEDDVEISSTLRNIINNGEIARHLETKNDIDILFLECAPLWGAIPKLIPLAERAKTSNVSGDQGRTQLAEPSTIFMLDSRDTYAYCAAAYVVTPKGKKKLESLFFEENYKHYPIDQLYRHLIQDGSVVSEVMVPFLATPRLDLISSMINPDDGPEIELMDKEEGFWAAVTRRLLFAGAHGLDLKDLPDQLRTAAPRASPEYDLAVSIFGRMMLKA